MPPADWRESYHRPLDGVCVCVCVWVPYSLITFKSSAGCCFAGAFLACTNAFNIFIASQLNYLDMKRTWTIKHGRKKHVSGSPWTAVKWKI